jgi:6-phosphogluconolactonase
MRQTYDNTKDIAIEENPIQYATNLFIQIAKNSIETTGQFSVALSGGSTPKALYNNLKNYDTALDWSKVFIFWSDERSVGPDNPDSNFHMAMSNGIKDLPIPTPQIFRMKAEIDAAANAQVYENLIKDNVPKASFDLILLGMGDDGHTASLFPNTKALKETTRLVVENEVPQKETLRMTFTYPLISKAKHILFMVIGDGKDDMVKKVFEDKEGKYPSGKVTSESGKALWLLDEKSSSSISK